MDTVACDLHRKHSCQDILSQYSSFDVRLFDSFFFHIVALLNCLVLLCSLFLKTPSLRAYPSPNSDLTNPLTFITSLRYVLCFPCDLVAAPVHPSMLFTPKTAFDADISSCAGLFDILHEYCYCHSILRDHMNEELLSVSKIVQREYRRELCLRSRLCIHELARLRNAI